VISAPSGELLIAAGNSEDMHMFEIKPIGIIHSPFEKSEGTPIQPSMAEGVEGYVELLPEYAEGLKDLEGFDRIWLVYWFDRSSKSRLLVTPYLDDDSHGVFSTRAPSRPNPIGISAVKLLKIEKNILRIADVDILDNTPLLDIKPYVPRFDHFEVDRCGWLDKSDEGNQAADDRFEKK
jgi:tRNA-Thr(GGU) m(6)t(6)A37 methyltransferase TsaA